MTPPMGGIKFGPPERELVRLPQIFILFYRSTKSEGYSFGVVRPSVHSVRPSVRPSTLFVCPEPYLSTYWSDLIHSWYK